MTFVILSGGIDLSVGGVVALTTVASAALLRNDGMDPWLVIGLMLLMGMVFGLTMGFFITYLKVQPFIATLAGLWVARGLCFWISDDAIAIHNRLFDVLAQTKILIPGLADPATKQGPFISILVPPARTGNRRARSRARACPGPPGWPPEPPCYTPGLTAVTERSSVGRGRSERGTVRAARQTPARTSLASRAAGAR